MESAQELFQQAAVYYKANNRWESAGNAYLRAQECAAKLKYEATAFYNRCPLQGVLQRRRFGLESFSLFSGVRLTAQPTSKMLRSCSRR